MPYTVYICNLKGNFADHISVPYTVYICNYLKGDFPLFLRSAASGALLLSAMFISLDDLGMLPET